MPSRLLMPALALTMAVAAVSTAAAQGRHPPRADWYFCEGTQAYYPYVASCPEGWRAVPAMAGALAMLAGLNRERGITVLMVTHEPDMAAYARRIVRFVDGRVASDTSDGTEAAARAARAPAATPGEPA